MRGQLGSKTNIGMAGNIGNSGMNYGSPDQAIGNRSKVQAIENENVNASTLGRSPGAPGGSNQLSKSGAYSIIGIGGSSPSQQSGAVPLINNK